MHISRIIKAVRTINDLLDNELNVVKSHILRNVKVNKKLKGFYLSKIRENAFKKFLLQIYGIFICPLQFFVKHFNSILKHSYTWTVYWSDISKDFIKNIIRWNESYKMEWIILELFIIKNYVGNAERALWTKKFTMRSQQKCWLAYINLIFYCR